MVEIKFNDEENKKLENKENESLEDSQNLENIALEELKSMNKSEDSDEENEERMENKEDEEEFGDISFDDDEIDFSMEKEPPKSADECKLSAILDYAFFFYFMMFALFYKELKNKAKFVKNFIEKNKQAIDEIKIRIERVLANTLPKTYEKLIKLDDYAFILGILMLTVNFHIEVQEAILHQNFVRM
ncbi:hypothetical protein Metvu_1031 [Methanocaldococcus vulcanius M7]|uniref:Uncharacterized protein n=1 Tax=Methanocaldococcus vulcanius (strain ATCC 700851 / DSM 12094 / M7) TaxID=579137 RepID=C9RH37_METVM|nr:hypothetical protein [Methanocaldococcus vulcanius]ACX72889.1 hypothetical protein Metvu_1031 [Methanocaldococcus vulcanius M7]